MSTTGIKIDLDGGWMVSPHFTITSNGKAYFSGELSAATGSFSGSVTATTFQAYNALKMYSDQMTGDGMKVVAAFHDVNEDDNDNCLQMGLTGWGAYIAFHMANATSKDTNHASTYLVGVVYIGSGGAGELHAGTIYGTVSSSSDRRLKEEIMEFSQVHEDIYMDLRPVSFRYKNFEGEEKKHDRPHYGFIAQEIEEAFEKRGITTDDYGIICKQQDGTQEEIYGIDKDDALYYMRSSEIVPLNTHMTQKALRHQKEQDALIEGLKAENVGLKESTDWLKAENAGLKEKTDGLKAENTTLKEQVSKLEQICNELMGRIWKLEETMVS